MPATFTYTEGDISTPLNWARWRLDDTNPEIRSNYQGDPAPYLWDEDYLFLFDKHGVQEGTAQAAERINLILSKQFTRFSNLGTSVSFDRDVYKEMARVIRAELPFDSADRGAPVLTVGMIAQGVTTPHGTGRFRSVITGGVLQDGRPKIVPHISALTNEF